MRYIVRTSPTDRIVRFLGRLRQDAWEQLREADAATVIVFTAVLLLLWGWWVWALLKRRRDARLEP